MLDFRPVFFITGWLLCALAGTMTIPAVVDAAYGDKSWLAFLEAAGVTAFVGVAFILCNQARTLSLSLRQAFAFTTLTWVFIAVFAALPFLFSPLDMDLTDSLFESMSGITTTGSTVMVGLDVAPRGILLWRSILQWLGGVGIIVFAMSVLPILQIGGMQLFRTEAFDTPDKVLPRAAQLAFGIGLVYVLFTVVAMVALRLAGMPWFDAVAHAMTSIATGGYSTHDLSIGYFNSHLIDWIIVCCMIAGALPFVHFVDLMRGRVRPLARDTQVYWFLAILFFASGLVTFWLFLVNGFDFGKAISEATFNVTSMMTGTGYATADFATWGGLPTVVILTVMFVGGCAGSTSCGIKIFRFQVAYAIARTQMRRLMQPHGVFIPYFNRRPVSDEIGAAVMGFFFLFVASFMIIAVALSLTGLDFMTAVSGAATTIANVGPGLGPTIGPDGNFKTLPDAAKWIMTAGMLVGRLEIFSVLILFTPAFWRG